METRVSAGLNASEGRRFGFTLGAAFTALAGVAAWRDHRVAATIFGTLGGLLLVAGLLFPVRLVPVQRAWMGLAAALSKITTPVFMGVVYFVVVTPLGLLLRALGRNPLMQRRGLPSCWIARSADERSRHDMERQF